MKTVLILALIIGLLWCVGQAFNCSKGMSSAEKEFGLEQLAREYMDDRGRGW